MSSINNSSFHRSSVYRMTDFKTIALSNAAPDIFVLCYNLDGAQIKQFIHIK